MKTRVAGKRPRLSLAFPLLCLGSAWPAEAAQLQAVGHVVRDVVEVQHGGGAEDVHFRLLLLLPTRLAPAFLLPFSWLSKTSIYNEAKVSSYNLENTLKIYNFQHFPQNLRGQKVRKGKAVREVICSPMQRLPIKHRPQRPKYPETGRARRRN